MSSRLVCPVDACSFLAARIGLVALVAFVALVAVIGCAGRLPAPAGGEDMELLTVRWQRLVDSANETCPRCETTGTEVEQAVAHLRRSLAPAGIEVRLETERLSEAEFAAAPLESNRIWIAGRSLEEWLGASSAASPCCASCGDAECRTVSVGGQTYEAIPAGLIVRAGFLAAGEILRSAR